MQLFQEHRENIFQLCLSVCFCVANCVYCLCLRVMKKFFFCCMIMCLCNCSRHVLSLHSLPLPHRLKSIYARIYHTALYIETSPEPCESIGFTPIGFTLITRSGYIMHISKLQLATCLVFSASLTPVPWERYGQEFSHSNSLVRAPE